MVTATAGTMLLRFVVLGEGLRGASVGPACGETLGVVSSGVAFPKLCPWVVASPGEAASVTVTGADTETTRPPSSSMGAVGRDNLVGVKVVLFWGWCVTLGLLVSLGELLAVAAAEGTCLTTLEATVVLAWSLVLDCEMDEGDENTDSNDANE